MALRCPECGTRVSSKAALPGHYRRAGHLVPPSASQPALPARHSVCHAIRPGVEGTPGLSVRAPEHSSRLSEPDRLWAQYYALRAMAVKLDADVGTEQEEILFRRALAEYDSLFDRLKAAKVLPASTERSAPLATEVTESPTWWALA